MFDAEKRRELEGAGLIALALLVLLALVPIGWLGGAESSWFPSGNLMGPLGGYVRTGLGAVFGASALLIPLMLGLFGVARGGWLDHQRALLVAVFEAGLLVVVPPALEILAPNSGASGMFGRLLGRPLADVAGAFGGIVILVVLLALLSLATIGWQPVRGPVAWGARSLTAGWRTVADWLEGREDASESPIAYPEPPAPPEPELVEEPLPKPKKKLGIFSTSDLPDPRDPSELTGGDLPPLELLTPARSERLGEMHRDLDALGQILVQKLGTFGVESELAGRTTGPVVTQFEVVPAPGVKVNRIANLDRDLALALRAKTVRIVAPIPGKGAVGVEIPNPVSVTVQLREILEAPTFGRSRADLPLALGKDLHGAPYVSDLAKMPHCLIAGATGSGKSVCLNTIITSLVYRHTPETLRLLLIDPKMVELSTYRDLPHLRHPVVTDPKDAAGVLKWATLEMERRYALLSENGVRSIGEFNRRLTKGTTLRRVDPVGDEGDPDRWIYDEGILPYVVLVVDELADLMMSVQSEVEKPLTLLAQKARAIGLHLIVATQRPSVNVITGLIKANFPCRIAFRVASKTDSRTILDQNGADALLGNGDMLFLPPGQSAPIRMQGAFISTEDTSSLIDWYRDLRERRREEGEADEAGEDDILEMVRAQEAEDAGVGDNPFGGDWDEYFRDAAEVCITNEQGSTSLLQRKLRVGYGRAARIVDQLHDAGVLGPPDGSKPREVLMSLDQLERMLSGGEGGG